MESTFTKQVEKLRSEILTLTTFEEKLMKWAEFTVDYCDNIARTKKIDRAFYAFQSEPKFEPDVLLLGLNPHGDYPYTSQRGNAKWGLEDGMTPEVFIQQNPWYTGGSQATNKDWPIIKSYKKIINVHPDLSRQLDSMVYMNILYFNSIDFKDFKDSFPKDWKIVFDNCVQLSSLLIFEIIKPKMIVCFGIENCFDNLVGNRVKKELDKDLIYKTKINETKIYGIPHPSYRKLYDYSRERIGRHMYADWFKKPYSNPYHEKLKSIRELLLEVAEQNNLTLQFEPINLEQRFGKIKFFLPGESTNSICFEFQRRFYGDLMFGLHNGQFINGAKKCEKPFDDWRILDNNFNQESLKKCFMDAIGSLSDSLKSLT